MEISRDAIGVGDFRACVSHSLGEPVETHLAVEKCGADCAASEVGNDAIVRSTDGDDFASGSGSDFLLVAVITGDGVPEAAAAIHFGYHLSGGASCFLKCRAVEFYQEAIDQGRAVGKAEDGNLSRIDVVVLFEQVQQFVDEGDVWGFRGFGVNIPTFTVAVGSDADDFVDVRIEAADEAGVSAHAMKEDDDRERAFPRGNEDVGRAIHALGFLRPGLPDRKNVSIGEASIGRLQGGGTIEYFWTGEYGSERICVDSGGTISGESDQRVPVDEVGGGLNLAAFALGDFEGERGMSVVVETGGEDLLGHQGHKVGQHENQRKKQAYLPCFPEEDAFQGFALWIAVFG